MNCSRRLVVDVAVFPALVTVVEGPVPSTVSVGSVAVHDDVETTPVGARGLELGGCLERQSVEAAAD